MFWNGTPRAVAEWWTLTEGQRRAVCRMFTHVFGHELRLSNVPFERAIESSTSLE